MQLILVRHGESHGNAGTPYEGEEPHLTERGRRQAGYAAERARLRQYQALYTSPMSRALETACILAEATCLEPVVRVEFCEHRELPEFRGFPRSVLDARYPGIPLPEECTEEGWWGHGREEEDAMYERARAAAALLRARHEAESERILLVTHGGFGSALLSVLFGLPPCGYIRFWQDNCAFTRVDLAAGGYARLQKLNCTWHIPAEDRT
jgi:broad specificity phosphatase PhoE